MNTESKPPSVPEQLSQLFGSYKAEWLKEQIFELFTEPSYFPELMTPRSCILIGGRGTGKTTVLRGLSYEGQFALSSRNASSILHWPQYGVYYKADTNHVTAFRGPELRDDEWIPLFAHYFNILICDKVMEFLEWYEFHTDSTVCLGQRACRRISTSLHLRAAANHREIRELLVDSRIEFQAYINNVVDAQRPPLSLQAAPIDLLCDAILNLPPFKGKQFFFLIDEYENLLDYQQQVVNTLIKHAGEFYSFKIGVRELGWRRRSTLNENEQLVHPADYARIDITEKLRGKTFDTFALDVCGGRIARLQLPDQKIIRDVQAALPGLSEEEEAIKLGVEALANPVRENVREVIDEARYPLLDAMHPLEVYFIHTCAQAESKSPGEVFEEAVNEAAKWAVRFGNYKHALLYTIRPKKRGICKYYSGWSIFTQLAAGNIRYLLNLVDQSLLAQFRLTERLDTPVLPDVQTKAAQQVGKTSLSELEGSVGGAQLTKLLLSLGRVFQVMARDALGHAPEVNQFQIIAEEASSQQQSSFSAAEQLLNSAVMHLALLRRAGNKLGDVGDTRDYDYMIHPIYSPYFVFSFRRKRKMSLRPETLLGLIRRPKHTIREVLKANNRALQEELPEQLTLFERFYDADT